MYSTRTSPGLSDALGRSGAPRRVLGLHLTCDQEQVIRVGVSCRGEPGVATVRGARVQPLDEHDVDQSGEDGAECPVEPGHEVTSTVVTIPSFPMGMTDNHRPAAFLAQPPDVLQEPVSRSASAGTVRRDSQRARKQQSSGDVIPEETAAQMAEARGFEPRMAAKPNRISSAAP